jgi:peroxiredoxin
MDDVMASPGHRDLSTPKLAVGDPAFRFTLPVLDGQRQTGELVSLGDFAGKRPVALIFGSYT